MVNTQKIKGRMRELNYSQEQVANMLGIDPSTLYRKLNAQGPLFSIGEAQKLGEILKLSGDELMEYFFCETPCG